MSGKKFVGFGFGPIQSGLMLYEAVKSGNFSEFVIAEIDQNLVDAIRKNGNKYSLNIAHSDHISTETIENIWVGNPANPDDRKVIAKAIFDADEMATAIPTVKFYTAGGQSSIVQLLAENINPNKPQLLYASENNNFAAEILLDEIKRIISGDRLKSFQILNTVIGKMSGVKQSIDDIKELGLTPIVPDTEKAILVEEFNKILVTKVNPPAVRQIPVFEEKDELLPFEEAKLYGHNAIHSVLGYLAYLKGYRVMSDIRQDGALLTLGRNAFLNESGMALIKKYGNKGDRLFTVEGFTEYVDDLLERMTNPYLHDEVNRICRDPFRKLSYDDRLIGTMRLCLNNGIEPKNMAIGAYAALHYFQANDEKFKETSLTEKISVKTILESIWSNQVLDNNKEIIIDLIYNAANEIKNYIEEPIVRDR